MAYARKMLTLACATRDSLLAEEQAAFRGIQEFQALVEITRNELDEIRVKKREAELQVAHVERSLEAKGIPVPPEPEPFGHRAALWRARWPLRVVAALMPVV